MGRANLFPRLQLGEPVLGVVVGGDGDAAFDAHVRGIPPGGLGLRADAAQDGPTVGVGSDHGEVAVGQPPDAADGSVGRHGRCATPGADPDGDGPLHRQRVDAGVGDVVILAVEVDDVLGPQLAQHLDLLVAAAAPGGKVHAQRLVLHRVPAYADAQAQPPAGQQVDLRRLFGHQRRLPLRQDQDAGGQPDRLGDRR